MPDPGWKHRNKDGPGVALAAKVTQLPADFPVSAIAKTRKAEVESSIVHRVSCADIPGEELAQNNYETRPSDAVSESWERLFHLKKNKRTRL